MTSAPRPDPQNDLSATEEWFRDTFYKVLGWGSALAVLIVGWTIRGEDLFSLGCDGTEPDPNVWQRTMVLVIAFPVAIVFWNILAVQLRRKCADHITVPRVGFVYSYLAAISLFSIIVLFLIVD